MFKITGNTIILTRGDTLETTVSIFDKNENVYTPGGNDVVRFALKKKYTDEIPIILKTIPNDTMLLRVESSETKQLEQPASYVYDVQITIDDGTPEGFVCTFISGTLKTKEEVE